VLPAIEDAEDGAVEGADVRKIRRPRRRGAGRGLVGVVAGLSPGWCGWCAHSVVTSAAAVRADFSSAVDLSVAKAAARACTTMLLTARVDHPIL
jgi:hypothetical protein